MANLSINREKYGVKLAFYLYDVEYGIAPYYCGWTFQEKTKSVRTKNFKKLFNGPKENYKPDEKIHLN